MANSNAKKDNGVTHSVQRCFLSTYGFMVAGMMGFGLALPANAQSDRGSVSDVKLEIGVEHNSNVSRSDAARAAARGLEQSDQRITPAIRIDLARNLGQTELSLSGTAGYDSYARNTQLNRERIDFQLGLGQPVGPCKLEFSASAARRQSDLGDIAFVNNTLSSVVKNAETRLQYSADVGCGRPYGFRPTAHIDYLTARNSNIVRDRSEFDQLEYRGGVEYSTPNFGQLALFVGRRDITLRNQPTAGGSEIDFYVTTFGAQYRRNIGSRLNAEVTIGRSQVSGGGALVPSASGITWEIALTAQIGSRLQVTGSTGRQFTNSLSSDAAFLRAQPNFIDFTYAVNGRLRLQAGYSDSRNRYSYATTPTGVFITRDRRQLATAGLTYAFGRRWQLGLIGGYEQRNANGTFFDYDGGFARATLSLTL